MPYLCVLCLQEQHCHDYCLHQNSATLAARGYKSTNGQWMFKDGRSVHQIQQDGHSPCPSSQPPCQCCQTCHCHIQGTLHRRAGHCQQELSSTTWLGIPIFGSNFWDPYQKRNSDSVFDSKDSGQKLFLNSAVEKLRNWNSNSEIQNSKKNGRRNSIHLISYKTSIVIGQPVDLMMLNRMDVGTILSKAIFVPIYHLLNMSRCDFCGLNDHATKLTSRVLKMSRCDFLRPD